MSYLESVVKSILYCNDRCLKKSLVFAIRDVILRGCYATGVISRSLRDRNWSSQLAGKCRPFYIRWVFPPDDRHFLPD